MYYQLYGLCVCAWCRAIKTNDENSFTDSIEGLFVDWILKKSIPRASLRNGALRLNVFSGFSFVYLQLLVFLLPYISIDSFLISFITFYPLSTPVSPDSTKI